MKYVKGVLAGALTAVVGVAKVAAQTIDTAAAGNGGVATAAGNGGAVSAGDINSGGNVGSAIAIGDTYADPQVYGGDVADSTSLGVGLGCGTGISKAPRGEQKPPFVHLILN